MVVQPQMRDFFKAVHLRLKSAKVSHMVRIQRIEQFRMLGKLFCQISRGNQLQDALAVQLVSSEVAIKRFVRNH